MKKRFLDSEIFLPFSDYNKLEEKRENIIKSIVYVILAIIIEIGLLVYYKIFSLEEFRDFLSEYISSEIEIIALLLSFSIAYLTILITSDSENVKRLKMYCVDKKIDGKNISLYQILLIQITYTIYNEIVLLILLLIHKFIFPVINSLCNIVFFCVNIVILLNIIYIIVKNVKNIYLSFWKTN